MKTCLIYGHDGLDLDVTYNLTSFYKGLGFKVFFSRKLYKADLLVVLRALDLEIDISAFHYSLVHVYDYTGWDYDAFVRTIDHSITFIFCTSEIKKARLTEKLNFPQDQIFIALPPVDVTLWSKKLKDVKYNLIHIGNFKEITEIDNINVQFNKAIGHFKIHVWGSGWMVNNDLYHGKAGLFQVSSIYSKSEFAFGLMYPFQREVTFSGRFWHAPLNGCFLLSEPGLYTQKMPGIIETDYSINDVTKKIEGNFDRKTLQKESQEFWEKQYRITLGYVTPTLSFIKNNNFYAGNYLTFLYLRGLNILIKCYQKSRLSYFIKRK